MPVKTVHPKSRSLSLGIKPDPNHRGYYGPPNWRLLLTASGPYAIHANGTRERLTFTDIEVELPSGSVMNLGDLVQDFLDLAKR